MRWLQAATREPESKQISSGFQRTAVEVKRPLGGGHFSLAPGDSIAESGDSSPLQICVFPYKHKHSEAISKEATVHPVMLDRSDTPNPFLAIP
jgi:hypothetical protein